jgi:hypothetical protein
MISSPRAHLFLDIPAVLKVLIVQRAVHGSGDAGPPVRVSPDLTAFLSSGEAITTN